MVDTAASGGLYACIDIGTNSVKVVIANLTGGLAVPVYELSATTRLGEGMLEHTGCLQEAPIQRTMEALGTFVRACRDHNVIDIACVGTAALREAENSDIFVARALAELGLSVEIISGEQEAKLSFLAVRRDPHWRTADYIRVIDVGGGSTEIIDGVPGSALLIGHRTSVRIGAVKVTERYLKSDPPTAQQLAEAESAAQTAFQVVPSEQARAENHNATVVGVGGTLTTLAAMIIGETIKDVERIHGFRLDAEALDFQISRLSYLSVNDRCALPGLDPKRADIILGGAIVLRHALSSIGARAIDVSTRGLRWGVLYDRFSA